MTSSETAPVPVPQAELMRWLREMPESVILRNAEDLFGNLQRGGDIDLLVGDAGLAERTLIRHLGAPVRIVRSSYVTGYSYEWGHIDVLPTIEWRGAVFLPTRAVLDDRQRSSKGLPVPRIAHEALISWLTNLLFGGFFKDRYAAHIRAAVENDADGFREVLTAAAGQHWGGCLWRAALDDHPERSAEWTMSLRRAVWWQGCVRSPVRTVRRGLAHVMAELRLRVAPPVPWIAIVGADTGGNNSLAQAIMERLTGCPYAPAKVCHWRPGAQRRSLLLLAAHWLVCYWTAWVHLRAKGYVLLMQGGSVDLFFGGKRQRSGAAPRVGRALRRVLPKPNLLFDVDSDIDAQANEVHRAIRSWMSARTLASLSTVEGATRVAPATAEDASGAPSR